MDALSGIAAQSVDARGQFLLPTGGVDRTREITAEAAKALAAASWRAPRFDLATFESDRGAAIHSTALQPCPRAFYVESAYSKVPIDAPLAFAKALGPHWLVGLCYGATEEVVISVSAYATDATLAPDGLTLTNGGDGNFLTMGVQVGAEVPMAPEVLANTVSLASRRRIALVPRLVMRAGLTAAQIAVWQVTLEAPVSATGTESHTPRSVQTFVAGALNGWQTPAFADQRPDVQETPLDESFQYLDPSSRALLTFTATRKPEVRPQLELITFPAS